MTSEHALKSTRSPRTDSGLWKKVLDSLTAEVAVIDDHGTIVAINDAWERFALENNGSLDKTCVGVNYLSVCRAADGKDSPLAEQAYRGIRQVINGERDVFKLEYPCHSATLNRWFLLYASRLQADERYVVTTHLTITDRKIAEQRLVFTERLAAIGEAMQGLSHEGRNALQRAQAYMDLLRFHIENDKEALRLLERIESAQHHLLGLYEEVRSYAAPIVLRCEPYALDQLVDEFWATFTSRPIPEVFSHLRGEDDLTCDIDVSAIRHVLQLVFDNAVATDAKPLKIEVSYIDDQLDGMPAVTIIVSDNGPGVPAEDREQVFEPFQTTKASGTGLGLAVCKRIVAAHRGHIAFGTPRCRGASVYITLPKQQPKKFG